MLSFYPTRNYGFNFGTCFPSELKPVRGGQINYKVAKWTAKETKTLMAMTATRMWKHGETIFYPSFFTQKHLLLFDFIFLVVT